MSFLYNKKNRSSLLTVLLLSSLSQVHSQSTKNLLLADKYFAAGDYYTAAGLYGQYLNPAVKQKSYGDFPLNSKKGNRNSTGVQDRSSILLRQAHSYRLANYWNEASITYQQYFQQDTVAHTDALYWYGMCQRSLGNYKDAEASIARFINTHSSNDPLYADAKEEQRRLQLIKAELARPDSLLYKIQKINTVFGKEKGAFAISNFGDDQIWLTSTTQDSFMKAGVDPFHSRLFSATLLNGAIRQLQPIVVDNVDASYSQGTACLSADGNRMYFTQWKKENGKTVSSIYFSTKKGGNWAQPVLVSSINVEGSSTQQPFCTPDGKFLFFASDRPGGSGGFDIWYANLLPDGNAGEALNTGTTLNTAANEMAPFYHESSRTLVFSSDRKMGMGGYDLYSASGITTQWTTVKNMGHPVNSSRDDSYFFNSQKAQLLQDAILSSDRGSDCCLESYTISKSAKKKLVTGVIRDCRNGEPLTNAFVEVKDGAGKSFVLNTASDGMYQFELLSQVDQYELGTSKELYKEKNSGISIVRKDDSHWQNEIYFNDDICLEKKLIIKPETVVTIYFDFDQSKLKDRGMAQLDSIYNVLIQDSSATIQISGYTDGRGSVEYNKKLSDRRAKASADYLIQKGIDATRISFESFGACCPVEMELINGRDNPDGRSMNRRALINISKN